MKNLFGLQGKVALVTGGAQGLGRMIAEGLIGAGARVYITSRKAEACKEAATELSRGGGACFALAADLSASGAVAALVSSFQEREKVLDILVNNAGKTWGAPLEMFPDKAWPSVMAVNVQVPFAMVREFLPALRAAASSENPARVLNIGSLAGTTAERLQAYSYSASKAAIHHLSRILAAELAHDHITVNAIVPGYFQTQMTSHIQNNPEQLVDLMNRIPLRRLGTPEDIAGMCIFLSSRAGAYVTGTEITLDGGLSRCK